MGRITIVSTCASADKVSVLCVQGPSSGVLPCGQQGWESRGKLACESVPCTPCVFMVPGVSPPLLSLPHLLTQGGHPLTFYPSPSPSGTLSILPSVVLSPSPWCLELLRPSLCHFFSLDSQGGFSSIHGKDFFSLLGRFSGLLCAKPFQGSSRRSLSRQHPTGNL